MEGKTQHDLFFINPRAIDKQIFYNKKGSLSKTCMQIFSDTGQYNNIIFLYRYINQELGASFWDLVSCISYSFNIKNFRIRY